MAAEATDLQCFAPADQLKLVLMRAITQRLLHVYGDRGRGTWANVSRGCGLDESLVSRLRAGDVERFKFERLVELCEQIGVEITLTAR